MCDREPIRIGLDGRDEENILRLGGNRGLESKGAKGRHRGGRGRELRGSPSRGNRVF